MTFFPASSPILCFIIFDWSNRFGQFQNSSRGKRFTFPTISFLCGLHTFSSLYYGENPILTRVLILMTCGVNEFTKIIGAMIWVTFTLSPTFHHYHPILYMSQIVPWLLRTLFRWKVVRENWFVKSGSVPCRACLMSLMTFKPNFAGVFGAQKG